MVEEKGWIYNPYKAWQEQLCFMSESTIRRTIKNLIDKGIVITANFNKAKFDKTLWYSIDYDKLDEVVKSCNILPENPVNYDTVNLNTSYVQSDNMHTVNLNTPIPSTNINNILPSEDDNHKQPTCEFTDEEMQHNFKVIYDEYPRKEGKTRAYAAYRQWIMGKKVTGIGIVKLTNEEMYEAVVKYAKECADNKRETQYIKHASTFFNNILDFVG
jgi:hypothetical protein